MTLALSCLFISVVDFEYAVEEVTCHGAGALLLFCPLEDVLAPPILIEVFLLAFDTLDVLVQGYLNLMQLVVVVVRDEFSYLGLGSLKHGLGPELGDARLGG